MKSKFKPGQLVKKLANAGFVGEELLCRIPEYSEQIFSYPETKEEAIAQAELIEPCWCDNNQNCVSWNTLEVVDPKDLNFIGGIYHVSECFLVPYPIEA